MPTIEDKLNRIKDKLYRFNRYLSMFAPLNLDRARRKELTKHIDSLGTELNSEIQALGLLAEARRTAQMIRQIDSKISTLNIAEEAKRSEIEEIEQKIINKCNEKNNLDTKLNACENILQYDNENILNARDNIFNNLRENPETEFPNNLEKDMVEAMDLRRQFIELRDNYNQRNLIQFEDPNRVMDINDHRAQGFANLALVRNTERAQNEENLNCRIRSLIVSLNNVGEMDIEDIKQCIQHIKTETESQRDEISGEYDHEVQKKNQKKTELTNWLGTKQARITGLIRSKQDWIINQNGVEGNILNLRRLVELESGEINRLRQKIRETRNIIRGRRLRQGDESQIYTFFRGIITYRQNGFLVTPTIIRQKLAQFHQEYDIQVSFEEIINGLKEEKIWGTDVQRVGEILDAVKNENTENGLPSSLITFDEVMLFLKETLRWKEIQFKTNKDHLIHNPTDKERLSIQRKLNAEINKLKRKVSHQE